jgi:hypothetical protein
LGQIAIPGGLNPHFCRSHHHFCELTLLRGIQHARHLNPHGFREAPSGQDFFKQSTTRLYFIAEKIVEMTVEMYRTPKKMVEETGDEVTYGITVARIKQYNMYIYMVVYIYIYFDIL